MRETKQVIVIRKDLKMRRGKEIAQGAHASMAWLTRGLDHTGDILHGQSSGRYSIRLRPAERDWVDGSFAKVTCQVPGLNELLEVHYAAMDAGLKSIVITDSGRTEFGGTPTVTCCAIGPDYVEKIDAVTGKLKLY